MATSDALGAYAEYCVAPADLVTPVPHGISSEVAASALLKGHTAHLLIKSVYPVCPGDTVLLHAGAGGVGLILTQWATTLGAHVITTVSTPRKAALSRAAGAITVTTGERYRLHDAARAHRDLESRKTHGSTVLIP